MLNNSKRGPITSETFPQGAEFELEEKRIYIDPIDVGILRRRQRKPSTVPQRAQLPKWLRIAWDVHRVVEYHNKS